MKWSIPERIVQQGRDYVREQRVVEIKQDMENHVWRAEVIGSTIYHVVLDGSPREKDQCECAYWQERGYCAHTVAVELALKEKGIDRVIKAASTSIPRYVAPSIAHRFSEELKKIQTQLIESSLAPVQSLALEIHLENIPVAPYYPERDFLGLSFKLGFYGERLYIVKDVPAFFNALEEQSVLLVNEQAYTLRWDCFDETLQEILRECLALFRSNQVQVPVSKKSYEKRYLILPAGNARNLVQRLMDQVHLQVKIAKKSYSKLTFTSERLPLTFEVAPTVQGYQIKVSAIAYYFQYYRWLVSENTVYELTVEQQKIYEALRNTLKRVGSNQIDYQVTEVPELFTAVLPTLAKIGEVQIAPATQKKLEDPVAKPSYHLTLEKGRLRARIDIHYGAAVFSSDPAFTKVPAGHLVLRDAVLEAKIEQTLLQLGYQKGEHDFYRSFNQENDQQVYRFFVFELPKLRRTAKVLLAPELQELFVKPEENTPSIKLLEKDSWLEVQFDISEIPQEEVQEVLVSLMKQQPFHRLMSGKLLDLKGETFQEMQAALSSFDAQAQFKSGSLQLPKYQALTLQEAFQSFEKVTTNQEFKKMVKDLNQPEQFEVALPKALKATLRPYQYLGFQWLKMLRFYHFSGILADDMGLGKTIQMLTFLLSEKELGNSQGPSLIVAPASLIYNWEMEAQKFTPSLRVCVITGNQEQRHKLLAEAADYDLLITSYGTLRQDIEQYQQLAIDGLILDEAQMVKNTATKTFQLLRSFSSRYRFALSGTPIENNIEELWALFQVLMPGFFPSIKKFKQLSTQEIAKRIRPFVLRREKEQVLTELPAKIETDLYSSLTMEQKKIYLAYLEQMRQAVAQMSSQEFKKQHLSILAGLTRLRQVCCDPHLLMDDYKGTSGKLEQLKNLLQNAKENHRRVLLFSQFTSMLTIIEEMLPSLGLSSFYLRGSTKAKDRIQMVEAFNQGEKDVFLISLKAGGTGLNLTGADTVILYDLWWNPAVEEQATSRAHRMGQEKVVDVWRLIAEGTIEEKIAQLQSEKRALFEQVISGESTSANLLTEEDIRLLLS